MNDKEKISFKKKLLDHCNAVIKRRMDSAKTAMEEAQASANSEGKSSAGDKYETSRAMGQLDRDMNARQLEEAQRDLNFLNAIRPDVTFSSVQIGSVVVTEKQTFFISIGLGTVTVDSKNVLFLSAASPLAKAMEGKNVNEQFIFRDLGELILDVY